MAVHPYYIDQLVRDEGMSRKEAVAICRDARRLERTRMKLRMERQSRQQARREAEAELQAQYVKNLEAKKLF